MREKPSQKERLPVTSTVSLCSSRHDVLLLAVSHPALSGPTGPPLALLHQHLLALRQTIPQVQPPRQADGEGTLHSAQWTTRRSLEIKSNP